MEIKEQYLRAMREQAPGMFNELRRSGAMDAHLQKKAEEAAAMFDQIAASEPKLPNGLVADAARRREIEEQVRAALIEFPVSRELAPDGEQIPETAAQNG